MEEVVAEWRSIYAGSVDRFSASATLPVQRCTPEQAVINYSLNYVRKCLNEMSFP
jgi:hypothetical protein